MKAQNLLWAAALLLPSAGASWKQALKDYNFPDEAKLNTQQPSVPLKLQEGAPAYGTVDMEPMYFKDKGSKRKQIKYGSFSVPPMNQTNGMIDYLQIPTTMPCSNCTITYINAGLEYPNGTYANANTSLWLHHIVFIDVSTPDTVCGSNYYGKGQRWFASGNERTPVDLTVGGKIPAGYYVSETSFNVMLVELMNMEMTAQDAVVTVIFEYIPGSPSDIGFESARPIWLDIAGCEVESDMPVKSQTTFSYTMTPAYKSAYAGPVLAQGGHIHDGGINIDINKNGQLQCDCVALYGTTPGYVDTTMMMIGTASDMMMPMSMSMSMSMSGGSSMNGMMMDPMDHISEITGCVAPTTDIAMGDELSVTAYYNFTAHAPMLNWGGSYADIMGISMVWMAPNMPLSKLQSYVGNKKIDIGLSMMGGHASGMPITSMTTPAPTMTGAMSGMSMSGMSMGGMSMMSSMSMGMSMGSAAMASSTAAAAKGASAGSVGGLMGAILAALALW